MLEVAQIVAEHFPGTRVQPATSKDMVQKDAKNEPDPHILKYWRPEIRLRQGIAQVIDQMKKTHHA
jgi:hypothetical protein